MSPLETAARESVTAEAKKQNAFKLARFAERDFDGGVSLNSMRLERLACCKALEGLAKKHPKRKTPFLESYHLMAANAYHADCLAIEGHRDTTIRERVDISSKAEGGLAHRMDAMQKLARIKREMDANQKAAIDRVVVTSPDQSMAQIWPERAARNRARVLIKQGLHQLAILYGLVKA